MRTLSDSLRLQLSTHVHKTVLELFPQAVLQISDIYDSLVEPPNLDLGDLAFGCFVLAKQLRKGPPQISTELAAKIPKPEWLESLTAVGPYLNFRFTAKAFGEQLLNPIIDGSYFQQKLSDNNLKTMIEYSQPNTHKELHVGHMRNACLGHALVQTMRYAGIPVIASTFPGDVGTHVAKCLWYLKYHNQEPVPETGRGEWLGKMYSRGHLLLDDQEKTPQYESNKKQLTEILHQLEAKKGEFFEQWVVTRQWSIELMQQTYKWAGITFDQWYWESEVDSPSVQYVKELYAQGKLEKSEGAIGMDLAADNLGFCLLLKTDGTGLYATKDVELAKRKFSDFKIDQSIYVVDMRQALHFKQVFKVLERLGFEQAKDCLHLQYNFVELPDGAMSSRKGNIVPLLNLVHSMETMVKEKYLARYKGEWSEDEINLVAWQVAQGAIKYGMVKIDNNKKIVFDMEEWLKIDGDSGPSIQYAAARSKSLGRKLGFEPKAGASIHWKLLTHKAERNLLQSMLNFHQVVLQSAGTHRPSLICTYLYDLSKRYNQFYHDCSVKDAETPELRDARLALSFAVGQVLQKGLSVIGIPTPERM